MANNSSTIPCRFAKGDLVHWIHALNPQDVYKVTDIFFSINGTIGIDIVNVNNSLCTVYERDLSPYHNSSISSGAALGSVPYLSLNPSSQAAGIVALTNLYKKCDDAYSTITKPFTGNVVSIPFGSDQFNNESKCECGAWATYGKDVADTSQLHNQDYCPISKKT